MKEKSPNDVICGADHTFGFAVLRRCVWARMTEDNAMVIAKSCEFMFNIFGAIIALYCFDCRIEFCFNVSKKQTKSGEDMRFRFDGKNP